VPGVPARSLPLIAWAALLFAACTLEPGEGKFVCEADDDCPKGWECQRKRCYIGEGNGDDTSRESSQETATATADSDTDTGTVDTDTGTPDSDTGTATETDTPSADTDTPTESDTPADSESGLGSDTDTPTVPDTDSSTDSETLNGTDLSTETETVTTSTDTGPDTGTGTVPSDTSTCECELGSGPCCNADCQLYTRVDQHTCSSMWVLSCKTSNCGGVVEQVSSMVVCDGKSAHCQGSESSLKDDVTICQATQKCVEDGTDASCVEDTGCL
jgi:hypothetical protein